MGKFRVRFKHTLGELSKTENGRHVKTQCKEYGVNRYVFLLIAVYAMITLGRFMWAFPSFYEMFLKSGAYRWLCDDSKLSKLVDGEILDGKCSVQDVAISNIFSVVSGSTLFGSIFAAASNIIIGAKITATIGAVSMFIGTLFLGYSSEAVRLYIPGAVFLGAGMDFVVLPAFNANMLFPGKELLITSILSSSISIGMYLPPLMKLIMFNLDVKFSTIMLVYGFLSSGLLIFLFIMFYPPKRFYKQEELDNEYYTVRTDGQIMSTEDIEDGIEERTGERRSRFLSMFGIPQHKSKLLKRSIISQHFLLITLIFVFTMINSVIYLTLTNIIMDETQRNFLSIGIASAFILCLLLSPFVDRIGSMYIIWFEIFCLIICTSIMYLPTNAAKYTSIVFYSVFMSYFNGQIWIFTVETFDPEINTLALGLLNAISGIITLIMPIITSKFIQSGIQVFYILYFVSFIHLLHIISIVLLDIKKNKQNKIE